ncbi:unnamed protein product [Urochloa decumbens]|uniref:Uncharacterized protein n=1 Tax=Urochloa decumbens TaxID=240449 RepID=A0ABC9AD76_9POAL
MTKNFSSCLSSLPAMSYVLVVAIMLAIAISSCPVAHCSEVVQAAHDAASVAHPDGGHWGMEPPAPHGGPVYAYDVPPPPEPQLRRRLLQRAG